MYEIACTDVKQVYWNNNFTYAAIVTKSRKLIHLTIARNHDGKQESGAYQLFERKL